MNTEQLELLRKGVAAFNEFRQNNPETPIDLRGADLLGANLLGADLSRADLRGANLDMSCLPLWCGSLRMKTDSRLRVQVAFHFASLIANCEDATDEEKKIYNDILDYVNKFHRDDVERLQPIQ